jgi:L-alanine-DL-glutamate epimerase-like enolase superfamily enzyme
MLMFDAFMGWDVTYAIEMAHLLKPLNPTGGANPTGTRRRATQDPSCWVPVATGEHVYTRWQVKELLANEALDFVQTDPD